MGGVHLFKLKSRDALNCTGYCAAVESGWGRQRIHYPLGLGLGLDCGHCLIVMLRLVRAAL